VSYARAMDGREEMNFRSRPRPPLGVPSPTRRTEPAASTRRPGPGFAPDPASTR